MPFALRTAWFSVRITRFEIGSAVCIVVAHDDITQRTLAEFKVQQATRILELQAATDGLTGAANRRSFDYTLQQEWKRHQRAHSPLSLAMLDVDCFKQYNDEFGHLAGDDCLKAVVQAIKSSIGRPGDSVARYGGEEFAVLLSNTDTAGAATVLENVLSSVRQLALPHPASKVGRSIVTVSIGCAYGYSLRARLALRLSAQCRRGIVRSKVEGGATNWFVSSLCRLSRFDSSHVAGPWPDEIRFASSGAFRRISRSGRWPRSS